MTQAETERQRSSRHCWKPYKREITHHNGYQDIWFLNCLWCQATRSVHLAEQPRWREEPQQQKCAVIHLWDEEQAEGNRPRARCGWNERWIWRLGNDRNSQLAIEDERRHWPTSNSLLRREPNCPDCRYPAQPEKHPELRNRNKKGGRSQQQGNLEHRRPRFGTMHSIALEKEFEAAEAEAAEAEAAANHADQASPV